MTSKIASFRCRQVKSGGGDERLRRAVRPVFHGDLSSAECFDTTGSEWNNAPNLR
ncbi:MAG: hypothetical protein GY758_34860 [Fuerstiella sp.]|nr:hypothetical protein [Fuerstiella sp.]MCP4511759.1 hypothetical protein [Fuerstiella sp.]